MVNSRAFAATARGVLAAAAAILALLAQAGAQARAEQGYPERTVRIIVPSRRAARLTPPRASSPRRSPSAGASRW
jgi:hypothetical protein